MAIDTALSGAQQGQQLAQAAGVANNAQPIDYKTEEAVMTPQFDAEGATETIDKTVDFGRDYISDKSTVAGQLDTLLKSDSPYIQEAQRTALGQAAARGLQNTSIAAGAGTRAAIQSALPIAQQDASTFAQSDLATQGVTQALEGQKGSAIIEGEMAEMDYTFQGTQNAFNRAHELAIQTNNLEQQKMLQEMQQNHQTIQAELDRLQQKDMAEVNFQYNKTLQDLQIASQEMMQQKDLDYQQAENFQNMSTQIMHDYQTDVTTLISDLNFLEMSSGDINKALNSLENMTRNNIQFAGSMAGIPKSVMNSYLSNVF